MVPPAVSKQISKLEEEVGAPLFLRVNGRVQLTETGEVLLAEARVLLRRSDYAHETIARAARGELGRIRVGSVELVMLSPLPMAIRDYRARHPDVRVELEEMTSAPQVQALREGTLDVAIVVGGGQLPPGLAASHLLSVPVGIALPIDHSLANAASLTLADVADDPLIMPPRVQEPTLYDQRIQLCLAAGFAPLVREERSFRSRLGLVAAGFGVTTVPGYDAETPPEGVVFKPLTGPVARFDVDILWRLDTSGPSTLAFIDHLRARLAARAERARV